MQKSIPNTKVRGSTYYAYVRIPKDVKKLIGSSVFEKSLGTSDYKTAKRKAAALVAQWWDDIDTARRIAKASDTASLSHLSDLYKVYQAEASKHPESSPQRDAIDFATQEVIEEAAAAPLDHRAWDIVTGRTKPLNLYIDQYLADLEPSVTARTYGQEKERLLRISESFPDVEDLTKQAVRTWLSDQPFMASTKKIYLAVLIRMLRFHDIPCEPLRNLKIKTEKTETAKAARAFNLERGTGDSLTSSELVAALDFLKGSKGVYQAALISLHTGMRTAEVTSLKPEDIDLDALTITVRGTKTKAATRTVPIHPALAESLSEGLIEVKTNVINRRMRSLRDKLGLGDSVMFYSFRKTFRTSLDYLETPLHICNDAMGHAQSDLGLRVYSQADRVEQLRKYVNRLHFTNI